MKTFIVTGGNKGIGKAICENLASNYPKSTIIFTSRSLTNGEETLKDFKKQKLENIVLEELDITDTKSIASFVKNFQEKYKNFDVLVNNAG
jgi:NAD(P)-dependent dehydrogenase (short-subunit alcohol dehydrogenase family)